MEIPEVYVSLAKSEKKWISQIAITRLAQKTVILVDTRDPYRLRELAVTLRRIVNTLQLSRLRFVVFDAYDGIDRGYSTIKTNTVDPYSTGSTTVITTQVPYTRYLNQAATDIETENKSYIIVLHNIEYLRDPSGRIRELEAIINKWIASEKIIESGSTLIIFTTNPSSFIKYVIGTPAVITPPLSTSEERHKLINNLILASSQSLSNAKIQKIIEMTRGLTMEQFDTVITKVLLEHGKLDIPSINKEKQQIIAKTELLYPYEPTYGFDGIGGYNALKRYLKTSLIDLILSKDKAISNLGLSPVRGLIFLGPPGTGKTLFARAIAYEAKIPFYELGNIFSKWLGESESNVLRVIRYLEDIAPAILFIDEIDGLGRTRTEQQHETRYAVFSKILSWLGDEKRRTIVIGTTNVPWALDEAFKRAGRFDCGIYIGYPDFEARKRILKIHLTRGVKPKCISNDIDLDHIAKETEYFTGAELEAVVKNAKNNAYQMLKIRGKAIITTDDLLYGVDSISIDKKKRKELEDRYLKEAEELRSPPGLLRQVDLI